MPELSRFFGIVIRMFVEAGTPHNSSHFHAYYQDEVGIFGIEPVELLAGSLPKKQRRLVEAWAELHRDELRKDWERLQQGAPSRAYRTVEIGKIMSHPIYRVHSVEIVAAYTLRVRFSDDSEQTIDLRPILAGDMYGPLLDPEVFNRVRVDREIGTLVWPNGADFDPATLHDWPLQERAFRELARHWTPRAA